MSARAWQTRKPGPHQLTNRQRRAHAAARRRVGLDRQVLAAIGRGAA